MTPRTTRVVAWTGADDDPDRLESAVLDLGSGRLDARGTSRATSYVAAWSLTTGDAWVTRRLTVTVHGDTWSRALRLERADSGAWSAESSRRGQGGPDAPPGLADPGSVAEALDCDIALCPVTNTMPILRHGLLDGPSPDVPHVMAWVDLPSLAVIRSEQVYRGVTAYDSGVGHAVVRYASARRDFVGDLTVDRDGIVVDYPQLARRATVSPVRTSPTT